MLESTTEFDCLLNGNDPFVSDSLEQGRCETTKLEPQYKSPMTSPLSSSYLESFPVSPDSECSTDTETLVLQENSRVKVIQCGVSKLVAPDELRLALTSIERCPVQDEQANIAVSIPPVIQSGSSSWAGYDVHLYSGEPSPSFSDVCYTESIASKPASAYGLPISMTGALRNPEKKVTKSAIDRLEATVNQAKPSKRNALQAKLNREKKKMYIQTLEEEVSTVTSKYAKLEAASKRLTSCNQVLQEEVAYLKSALANAPGLSSVLKGLNTIENVQLSTSFFKRKSVEMDHGSYPNKRSRADSDLTVPTGGVCLHVNGATASLEFCSQCARMAADV